MKKITIAIVDDHKLFREGIELLLTQLNITKNIYQASNGKEYLDSLKTINPDLVLMDINMPVIDGVSATIKSKKINNNIKIIALTMHDNIDYYTQMTEAGVDGFITKDTNSTELELAIKSVLDNKKFFSQKVLENVIQNLNSKKRKTPKTNIVFSNREKEVLQKMVKGLSNQEISEQLFLSPRTVERHKGNMYNKTNCNNAICLILFGLKNNIIKF